MIAILALGFHRLLIAAMLALGLGTAAAADADTVLVTAVAGQVSRAGADGPQPLQAFVKLREGDVLTLAAGASVQLVFLQSRREESWSGNGELRLGAGEGHGRGLSSPQVRLLPEILVRQIARMPSPESQGRAGAVRLRSLPEPLASAEAHYRSLREQADPADLNPELYWLASLFELREFDRLEAELADLRARRPDDAQVPVLIQLYRKAIRSARDAQSREPAGGR